MFFKKKLAVWIEKEIEVLEECERHWEKQLKKSNNPNHAEWLEYSLKVARCQSAVGALKDVLYIIKNKTTYYPDEHDVF